MLVAHCNACISTVMRNPRQESISDFSRFYTTLSITVKTGRGGFCNNLLVLNMWVTVKQCSLLVWTPLHPLKTVFHSSVDCHYRSFYFQGWIKWLLLLSSIYSDTKWQTGSATANLTSENLASEVLKLLYCFPTLECVGQISLTPQDLVTEDVEKNLMLTSSSSESYTDAKYL